METKRYRDIVRKASINGEYMIIGVEHQSTLDKNMIIRILNYDAQLYINQVESGKEVRPVGSFVFYTGDKEWTYPKSLKESLKVPPEMEDYINDWKLPVLELQNMDPQILKSKRLKEVVEIPVVCAGRMQPDEASASISEGKLDAMGIGRQFLVDPEYIVKLEQEKFSDILPCIACHNACLPIYHYEGVGCEIDEEDGKTQGHCALNPRTFCEQKYDFEKKAAVTKSIAVIGGGIAGMTVARIAAIRGHEVTIYEKSDRLCGVFNAAAAPEFKEKDKEFIQNSIKFVQEQLEKDDTH